LLLQIEKAEKRSSNPYPYYAEEDFGAREPVGGANRYKDG
jgi:hypothetical protein